MMPIILMLTLYISVLFVVAVIASRVTRNLSDYVLGGRHLSGPIAALGAGASDMSSWLLLALPGSIFTEGTRQFWLPLGLAIGAYCNWQFVATRLRVYTELANNALTIPSYFDNRFHDDSGLLRAVTALVILIFFAIYTAAGFVAGGLLANSVLHIPYNYALIGIALVIIIYTSIGGFLAVSWIDFFQGSLMFFALIAVPVACFSHLGGWHETLRLIGTVRPHGLDVFHDMTLLGIISLLSYGLGYMGQPHILVRFMATIDTEAIVSARLICMVWMIVALYGAFFVGIGAIAYFHGQGIAKPETAFLQLAEDLFNPWITGVLVAAVLSASMSSIAAQLLASSSAITEDFYHVFLRRSARSRELLWVGRLAVVMIALLSMLIAMDPDNSILNLVQYAWAGTGAAFGPIILVSLYSKNMSKHAAVMGMSVGALTVIAWNFARNHWGGIYEINEILPGFTMNTLVILLQILFWPDRNKAMHLEFQQMRIKCTPIFDIKPKSR